MKPNTSISIWSVTSDQPVILERGELKQESELERWIEQDIGLVNPDLIVVARQMRLNKGKLILDLLTVQRFGEYWGLIEIKRGRVGRETVGQALVYTAALEVMPAEELTKNVETYLNKRGVKLSDFLKKHNLDRTIFDMDKRSLVMYLVGMSKEDDLENTTGLLTRKGIPVTVVTFDLHENEQGGRVLVRETEQLDQPTVPVAAPKTARQRSKAAESAQAAALADNEHVQRVFALAAKNGIGEAFQIIYEAATKHKLVPCVYPHSKSIRYAPPNDKRRYLIYTPVDKQNGKYGFYVTPSAFAEFYPISLVRAVRILGLWSFTEATPENARRLAEKLDRLFLVIEANQKA